MLAASGYPGVWLNGPTSPAVRLVIELAALYLGGTFLVVGARNWLRHRLHRRLAAAGLARLPRERWRIAVETPGAAYRSTTREAVHLFVDERVQTVPLEDVRHARLVEDPAGQGEPELVAALHLALPDGEQLVVPSTATGFDKLVATLESRNLLERVELPAE